MGRSHADVVEAWDQYSFINREYRTYSLEKQKDYEENLVKNLKLCPKLFHSYIRRKKKGVVPVGPLRVGSRLISDVPSMCEILADEFCSHYRVDSLL